MERKPALRELIEYAYTVNWKQLGAQLGLSSTQLDTIEIDYSKTKSRVLEMFKTYLSTVKDSSRASVIKALESTSVSEVTLAHRYRTAIRSDELDAACVRSERILRVKNKCNRAMLKAVLGLAILVFIVGVANFRSYFYGGDFTDKPGQP